MSAALIARHLTVVRGADTVLSDVELRLGPGRRVGVVGPNGIGKSTLLQALAGRLDDPTTTVEGTVESTPPDASIGYLPQEPHRSPIETVDAFLGRRTGVTAAQIELDAATADLAEGRPGADDRYSVALQRWLDLGAADFEARSGQVFSDLSIDEGLRASPTSVLSGGQAARVSLASLLLSDFDIVLLDEPTNDLDLDGLDRLESWVVSRKGALALVSHDRAFLERTITDVVEIDHHSHRASTFAGGWTSFLAERELALQRSQQRYDEFDGQRQTLLDRRQREREWAARGAGRARKSGERDKHIRHHQLNQTEQLAGRSARTDRAIDRLEEVDSPRIAWALDYDIASVPRSGDIAALANRAVVERGSFRLGPVDLHVASGDRIAIVGENGSGKSTLLDLLTGELAPTSGSAGLGAGVVMGGIAQERSGFVGDDGLLVAFCAATGATAVTARTLLAKFGLGPLQLDRAGHTLSPGERTRAVMAVLMHRGANMLVLDEPTNHLDLVAIEQLEKALETFAGTLLVVTHDRELLSSVRFDRVLRVAGGVVTELPVESLAVGRESEM